MDPLISLRGESYEKTLLIEAVNYAIEHGLIRILDYACENLIDIYGREEIESSSETLDEFLDDGGDDIDRFFDEDDDEDDYPSSSYWYQDDTLWDEYRRFISIAAYTIQEGVIRQCIEEGHLEDISDPDLAEDIGELLDGYTLACEDYKISEMISKDCGKGNVPIRDLCEGLYDQVETLNAIEEENARKVKEETARLQKEYADLGHHLAQGYTGPRNFTNRNKQEFAKVKETYSYKEICALIYAGEISLSGKYYPYYDVSFDALARKNLGIGASKDALLTDGLYRKLTEADWETIQRLTKAELEKRLEAQRLKEEEAEKKRIEKEKAKAAALLAEGEVDRLMPPSYADLYPVARMMSRHFILHVGPTNSGKTYEAIERLKTACDGVYLAPLRLLAYEQYEKLNKDGYPCNLLTGEEAETIEGARLYSSTVEMADLKKHYDVAVIDEAQMVCDTDRGGAWANALLGLQADEIHVCCAPEAEELLRRIVGECQDTCETVYHERKTELKVGTMKSYAFPGDVEKGDALIVFSRRDVHAVASELKNRGHKCSIIYGALPYDVRHDQARRFMEGETDVVVATDAIGMGMNLPIRRIAFLSLSKYDGKSDRPLKPEEVRQIAGRAGRYGQYNTGYAEAMAGGRAVKRLYERSVESYAKAVIQFPENLLQINAPLLTILKAWVKVDANRGWKKADAERMLNLAGRMHDHKVSKQFLYDFVTIPFDEQNAALLNIWKAMFRAEETKDSTFNPLDYLPALSPDNQGRLKNRGLEMDQLETKHKVCDLVYTYLRKFHPENEDALKTVSTVRSAISREIMDRLSHAKLQPRKCKVCGKKVPWNHPYGMCESCYNKQRNYWYDEDYYW